MLTKLTIRNFKRFTTAEIELGNPVVFVGPNNSGKTTALQAIALWDVGLRRSKKNGDEGATINRNDLFAVPTPNANLLWNDLHVKDVHIEIAVEGVTADRPWTCGLRFEYANEESLYCRPLRNTPTPPEAFGRPGVSASYRSSTGRAGRAPPAEQSPAGTRCSVRRRPGRALLRG